MVLAQAVTETGSAQFFWLLELARAGQHGIARRGGPTRAARGAGLIFFHMPVCILVLGVHDMQVMQGVAVLVIVRGLGVLVILGDDSWLHRE